MNTAIKVVLGVVAAGGLAYAGIRLWNSRPKITIEYDAKNQKGTVSVNGKQGSFDKLVGFTTGATWNNWQLSILSTTDGKLQYILRHGSKVYEQGVLTGYNGGTDTVTINNVNV